MFEQSGLFNYHKNCRKHGCFIELIKLDMNRHSVHLIVFELSVFAIFVLFNYNTRTKTNRNPLACTVIKSDATVVMSMLNNGANNINAHNQKTSLILSTILKSDEIFNMPINVRCIKYDAPGSFIWTGNRSRDTIMTLMPAFHEN